MRSTSEMPLINMLISGNKEKFLIHPVIETFLKLKWKKTWKLYAFLVAVYSVFHVFLGGFALSQDTREENSGEKDVWWYVRYSLHLSIYCMKMINTFRGLYCTKVLKFLPLSFV